MVMRADLTTLRMFLAVHRLGNIAKAAEREHIAPSAISKRIQDLEAEVGAPLFYRHARGMTATPAGETLADHASRLFENVNQMSADLSAFTTGERGQVRIHAHQSAAVQHLPQELAAFRKAYPEIRVVLREETSPNVLQSMLDGIADIGIFADNTQVPDGLQLIAYKEDQLDVLLPVSHPLAARSEVRLSELSHDDFISLETGSSLQILVERSAAAEGIALSPRIEVVTFTAAVRMVEVGFGITIVPSGIATIYGGNPHVRSVRLVDGWARRKLLICVRDEARLTASARLMLKHLRQRAEG